MSSAFTENFWNRLVRSTFVVPFRLSPQGLPEVWSNRFFSFCFHWTSGVHTGSQSQYCEAARFWSIHSFRCWRRWSELDGLCEPAASGHCRRCTFCREYPPPDIWGLFKPGSRCRKAPQIKRLIKISSILEILKNHSVLIAIGKSIEIYKHLILTAIKWIKIFHDFIQRYLYQVTFSRPISYPVITISHSLSTPYPTSRFSEGKVLIIRRIDIAAARQDHRISCRPNYQAMSRPATCPMSELATLNSRACVNVLVWICWVA